VNDPVRAASALAKRGIQTVDPDVIENM